MEARERLLTPGEVATLFRVDPKTVTRWAAAGRISSIRTPGGHRRFRESEVRALLSGEPATTPPVTPEQATSTESQSADAGTPEPRSATPAQRSPASPS
ncbi:MAG: BldC family transcriptional regulator [Frankiaceae bacterium]